MNLKEKLKKIKMDPESEYVFSIEELLNLIGDSEKIFNYVKYKARVTNVFTTDDLYLPDILASGSNGLWDLHDEITEDSENVVDLIPTSFINQIFDDGVMCETFREETSEKLNRAGVKVIEDLKKLLKELDEVINEE
ncbi:MAG: hypothetical protein ACRCX2_17105 [Paraclostridium sp.]